ncbi:MAG: class I SAM-dependent methyltransferase [Bacteroidota bacterium]
MNFSDIRFKFVKLIYADHNSSKSVQRALNKVINSLGENELGLNVGAGTSKLGKNIRNLDIQPGENIDYVGKAEAIPVEDNFFSIIITQETLEHVKSPLAAIHEIYRVLKPNGLLYCQLPFIIGYHPGPTDYWRFSKEGIVELVEIAGFEVEECGLSVGSGTGFYRISVEFFSILLSIIFPFLYHFLKAFFAVLLYPIKWLDGLMNYSPHKDRIAGGYYVIAKKKQ